MEVVFLIGSIQAVFLALLIFIKKAKMLADKFLAIWLLFMGTHLVFAYLIHEGLHLEHPVFISFAVSFAMLEGAFTYIYVSILISKNQQFKWRYLIHLAPYVIFTAIIFFTVFNSEKTPSEGIYLLFNEPTPVVLLVQLLDVFLGPIYMIGCLVKLKKHQRKLSRNFSYTEEIDLNWLKYVIGVMTLVWGVVIVVNVLSDCTDIIDNSIGSDIIYGSVTVAIFFYGFFGIKQQIIYAVPISNSTTIPPKQRKEPLTDQYQKSGLKKGASEKYLRQLLQYMDEETPYLNGKLTLKEVALELEISSNHLSQVINENLDKNFFDFVNEYRIDFVKQKMEDPANNKYTILSLAYESGFNSKSGFNAIFKKYTRQTPSQYLKTL